MQEALARTAELETDLKKVAVELAEYKEESSHLKNQDIKITSPSASWRPSWPTR